MSDQDSSGAVVDPSAEIDEAALSDVTGPDRSLYRCLAALPWASWGDTLELTEDEARDLGQLVERL